MERHRAIPSIVCVIALGVCLAGVAVFSDSRMANAAVLFEDNFNDGVYDGWAVTIGTWAVEDGELGGIGAGGGIDAWIYAGDESWTDYVFETKVIFETGNAELVFRSTGHWQNEYRFSLWSESSPAYANRFTFHRYKDGIGTNFAVELPGHVDGNAPSPVPITNPAYARVEVKGNKISLFVNGQMIYELEDPDPLLNGKIGLGVIWSWQGRFDDVVVRSMEIPVSIDIKPGSDPNSINLSSAGVIPVAILSSDVFDATTVDPETVSLCGARVKVVGKSGKYLCHEQDINGDQLLDLVCQVLTEEFVIETGQSTAVLEAATYDGVPIRGEDSIRIVPDEG